MARFTHYLDERGKVDLLAGDVSRCAGCDRQIFRDHAFISDGDDPEIIGEPEFTASQAARGRHPLEDSALRVDPGSELCDGCDLLLNHQRDQEKQNG